MGPFFQRQQEQGIKEERREAGLTKHSLPMLCGQRPNLLSFGNKGTIISYESQFGVVRMVDSNLENRV